MGKLIGVALVIAAISADRGRSDSGISPALRAIIESPQFTTAHWGLLVADLETGAILQEHQADKLFAPASTTKLFSVAAALDELGADYQFETPVYQQGTLDKGGVLHGDLILVASGDLTLGGRDAGMGVIALGNSDHTYANGDSDTEWTVPDPLAGLNEIARQVKAAGIVRVTGQVLIDDRLFAHTESSGSGPQRVTPILVNDNVVDLLVAPSAVGSAARVIVRPNTALFPTDIDVTTVEEGRATRIRLREEAGRLVLRGHISLKSKPRHFIHAVDDPPQFARTLFVEALRRQGVAVEAPLVTQHPSATLPPREQVAKLPRVATFRSPKFSESAKLILKVSHNLHASTLPMLLAAKYGKRALSDGLGMERQFLERAGVATDTISFGGGAGGARADYVTPRATVQLLRHMATRKDFPVYKSALPILGVDGTLANICKSGPARGKVFAKTGTLYWNNLLNGRELLTSKALAGYMDSAKGRKLVFAFFVNNVPLIGKNRAQMGDVLGNLAEAVYSAY